VAGLRRGQGPGSAAGGTLGKTELIVSKTGKLAMGTIVVSEMCEYSQIFTAILDFPSVMCGASVTQGEKTLTQAEKDTPILLPTSSIC
jgi:hypothetical protein